MSIVNYNDTTFNIKSIDNSGNTLTLGANTTGMTIGNTGGTTFIKGNVQFGGQAGATGQYLKSNGPSTVPTWDTLPASTWVGTATSDLNMGANTITSEAIISSVQDGITSELFTGFRTYLGADAGNCDSTHVAYDGISIFHIGNNIATGTEYKKNSITSDVSFDIDIPHLTLQSGEPQEGNVFTANINGRPVWTAPYISSMGMALGDINMAGFNITNNGNPISFGTAGQTTTILGNLTIGSTAGTNGQILTSNGTTSSFQNPPASTWVGTASSNLDMGNTYDISGAKSIDNSGSTITLGANTTGTNAITIGKTGATTTVNGTLKTATVDNDATIAIGASTTAIGTGITIGKIGGTGTTTILGTLKTAIIDNSGSIIKIGENTTGTTAITIGNIGGTGTTSILGTGVVGGVTHLAGAITTCSSITNTSGTLNVGTDTTTLTTGKTTGTNNIQGYVQFGGQAGATGQYLKSNGPSTVPTWATLPASTWVGTAASNLNMANTYDIVGAKSIDNDSSSIAIGATTNTTGNGVTIGNTGGITFIQGTLKTAIIDNSGSTITLGANTTGTTAITIGKTGATTTVNGTLKTATIDNDAGSISLGANTTGMTIGKTTGTNNIQGYVQFNSQAGATGQVLQSNGPSTVPTWVTPSSSTWVGTAASTLNMGNTYNIIGAKNIDNTNGNMLIGNSTTIAGVGIYIGNSDGNGITNINGTLNTRTIDNANLSIAIGATTTTTGNGVTIGRGGGTTFIQGTLKTAMIDNSGSSITLGANTTGTNAITIGKPGATTTINGTGVVGGVTHLESAITNCGSVDNVGSALILGENTTFTRIGNPNTLINIKGVVQFNGNDGDTGQYLKSNGGSGPPTWATLPASTWVGTAGSNLNMANTYNIIGAKSIDNATLSIAIGATTTTIGNGVTIGNTGGTGTTSILGTLKTSTIDNNAGTIKIGENTTGTGVTIGNIGGSTTINGNGVVGGVTHLAGAITTCSSITNTSGTLNVGTDTTTLTTGKTTGTNNIQGYVQFGGQAGATGQYLKSNGPSTVPTWVTPSSSTWVGTAASNLNMANTYDIVGAKSIDNASSSIAIGATTTTTGNGVTIGNTGGTGTTSILGTGVVGGVTHLAGAITTCSSITNTSGALAVGTDTTTLTTGKTTGTNNIQGYVQFNSQPGATGQYLKSNGPSTVPTWATLPASTWVGTAASNLNMANTYDIVGAKSIDNDSSSIAIGATTTNVTGTTGVTIGNTGGTTFIQGTLKTAIIDNSGSIITLGANTTGTTAITIGKTGATTTVNGTGVVGGVTHLAGAITTCSSITNTSGTLNVGTDTTTLTTGKTTGTNNIQGYVQFNSQPGATGQYLKSNGPSTVPTWVTPSSSTWVGTAASNLNMGNTYDIVSAKSIDNDSLSIAIGATTTTTGNGVTIGNTGGTTFIQGTLKTAIIDNSGSIITLGANTTGTTAITIGKTGATTTVNGTGVVGGVTHLAGAITTCSSINNAGGAMTIGSSVSGMTIGNGANGTTINGILNTASIDRAGSITIGGTSATAISIGRSLLTFMNILSDLKCNQRDIYEVRTLDGTSTLSIGTATAGTLELGRIGQVVDIQGNLRLDGGSGSLGQVVTSQGGGYPAIWANPTNTFNGIATSDLNMGFTYNIVSAVAINSGNGFNLTIGNGQGTGILNLGPGTRTANINIGSTGWTNGLVNTYRPIAPFYTPATTGTNPVLTTTPGSTQIGYTIRYTANPLGIVTFTGGAGFVSGNLTNVLTSGIWIASITCSVNVTSAGGGSWDNHSILLRNGVGGDIIAVAQQLTPMQTIGVAVSGLSIVSCSATLVCTATTTIQLEERLTYYSGTWTTSNSFFNLVFTRLA